MSFFNTNQVAWDVEVTEQGDHSTPVDTAGIQKFLREFAGPKFKNYLVLPPPHHDGPAPVPNYELVDQHFFTSGPWRFNVERKRLFGSNHYRAGSFRVYEEAGFGGWRAVVHLPSGERRYGHLHPPKQMTPAIAKEAFMALQDCFSNFTTLPIHQGTAAVAMEQSIKHRDRPMYQSKRQAEPLVRVMQHLNTIIRSKEKKLSLIGKLWKATESATREMTYDMLVEVMRSHWSQCRGDSRMEFDNFIRDTMLTQLTLGGIVLETKTGTFGFAELGEILLDELLEEIQTQAEADRQQLIKSTSKNIERLETRETNLVNDLEKTRRELGEARALMEELKG